MQNEGGGLTNMSKTTDSNHSFWIQIRQNILLWLNF